MGRTRSASSDDIPIRDYVDMLVSEKEKALQAALLAQEKAVAAALASADKANDKSQADAENWRAQANEWRGAMSDRDRELPSRREVDAARAGLDDRIRRLEDAAKASAGRSQGINASAGVVVGAIAAMGTVIATVVVLANVLTTR